MGSDHSSHLTFTLARSVLPAVACDCLWLSVRLHVSFPSLPRLRCIPKPTAKSRASVSLPGPCLEQSLYWLRRSRHCSTGYQVTNCVPAVGIIRTVRGNSLHSLITSYIMTYAFCSSVVCFHRRPALGSFQAVKTGSSNSSPQVWPLDALVDSLHICSSEKKGTSLVSNETFPEKCNINFHSKNCVRNKRLTCQIFNGIEQNKQTKKKQESCCVFVLFSRNCDFFFFQLLNAMMSQHGKLMVCQYTRLYKTNQPTYTQTSHRHWIKRRGCLLTQISFSERKLHWEWRGG